MLERLCPAGLHLLATLGAVGCSGIVDPDEFISITTLSGDATLAAALSLPSGDGPFPAVVFVHGSGRVTRQDLEANSETLQSIGFASLRYDMITELLGYRINVLPRYLIAELHYQWLLYFIMIWLPSYVIT